jgi:hypothetical protein
MEAMAATLWMNTELIVVHSPGVVITPKVYDIDQLIDQFAFGIKSHPYSIKNFILYALNNFSTPPKFVFLIGKALIMLNTGNNESLYKSNHQG